MGADAASGKVATLDEWAEFLARDVRIRTERTILVGHSRGGIVISRTAELAPDRLVGLVYVAAVLAAPGQSMAQALAYSEATAEQHTAVAASADGRTFRWTSREMGRRFFYNETDAAIAGTAFDRLCPEPAATLHVAVQLAVERYGRVPRAYVECLRDTTISVAMQRRMVAAQPCSVWSIDTDHSPFYSRPDELVRILNEIAAGWK